MRKTSLGAGHICQSIGVVEKGSTWVNDWVNVFQSHGWSEDLEVPLSCIVPYHVE